MPTPKSSSEDFQIYVEPSCLTDSTDLMMQTAHRNDSDQTVIRHASYASVEDESSAVGKEDKDAVEHEDHDYDDSWQERSGLGSELSEMSHISGVTPMESLVSTDSHTEALIRNAAREVIARMEEEAAAEQDRDNDHDIENYAEDSLLSARTDDDSFISESATGDEGIYGDGTELSYNDEVTDDAHASDREVSQEPMEDEQHERHTEQADDADGEEESFHDDDHNDGSASSHHSDDVFSDHGPDSKRSSLNSLSSNPQTDGEHKHKPELSQHDSISRVPSNVSHAYSLLPEPLSISSSTTYKPQTPSSKVLSRPPFRTPSSVRAMQMSSPTPSIFSGSPRSSKRPTVSRLGTPTSHHPKTPTRFKAKKEYPLVLLHVTCLPSQFAYARLFEGNPDTSDWSRELLEVRESWRLVEEQLGDMVVERGILLPHPQDDFEVLEERLLEALELPVRPRARILSCGHYLGPADDDSDFSENENDGKEGAEKWCDICSREVKYEDFGKGAQMVGGKQKRFRVKVYASNGLMRAGAWAAAWREMERVDVEIQPFVPGHLIEEMDHFASVAAIAREAEAQAAEHEQEHMAAEEHHESHIDPEQEKEAARLAKEAEKLRSKTAEEERLREIYGKEASATPPVPEQPETRRRSDVRHRNDESLPELLLAAFKVAMRDQKNVFIFILSALVLVLALRPGTSKPAGIEMLAEPNISLPTAIQTARDALTQQTEKAKTFMSSQVAEMVETATEAAASMIPTPNAETVRPIPCEPVLALPQQEEDQAHHEAVLAERPSDNSHDKEPSTKSADPETIISNVEADVNVKSIGEIDDVAPRADTKPVQIMQDDSEVKDSLPAASDAESLDTAIPIDVGPHNVDSN